MESHLDLEMIEDEVQQIRLPNMTPKAYEPSQIPRDLVKSSTIETLISQNDDLMARLKVSLRRLSILETENITVKNEFSAVQDQLLIQQEKEFIWKQKFTELEKKYSELAGSPFNQENLRKVLNRYMRYQNRVQNFVRPMIDQMKHNLLKLEVQKVQLEKDHGRLNLRFQHLEEQFNIVSRQGVNMRSQFEKNQHDLINLFEKERADFTSQIRELKTQNEDLNQKCALLDRTLERLDHIENMNIELERSKSNLKTELDFRMEESLDQIKKIRQDLTHFKCLSADLQEKHQELKALCEKQKLESEGAQEQLASLRYQWTQKQEENEKYKMTIHSLEKLNVDLSQKLNQLRKESQA